MRGFLFVYIIIATIGSAVAQEFTAQQIAESLGNANMPVGAYYYPTHWPESEWERDIQRLGELGFSFTHLAEFAWAKLEPEEGQYDLTWLHRVVSLCEEQGVKVIMCTPTPTPPAWLTHKHPEILSVNADGVVQQHGSRLHVQYDHPVYLEYSRKIIEQLANAFGNHPNVAGWQLDNEPHFGAIYDYSDFAHKKFRTWLKEKYHHIDSLNRAWGGPFWSQSYNRFEQIMIPNANANPQGSNPHALLDFHKFTSDRLAGALAYQADLLREHIDDKQWITTNYAYFKFLPATDPFRNRSDFDFASHTMYLTSGALNTAGGNLGFRLGSGLELAFGSELAASVNGFTGIMELQPGQINWGTINPQPLPGAVRMWVWHSFGLGDAFVCAYRFRQPLFGGEQTHKGIMDTDGISVARGGAEYVQALQEIATLPIDQEAAPSASWQSRRAGLMFTFDNMRDLEIHRHHQDFDAWQYVYAYYSALKQMGSEVTLIQPGDKIEPGMHPYVIVPAFQQVSKKQLEQWKAYVQAGGHLVLTSRTAKKDTLGHLWKAPNQAPIWDLIGAEVQEFDHLPASFPGNVQSDQHQFSWHVWGDLLQPSKNTRVWATYADQYYQGTAAVTHRKWGKGTVTYIGTASHNGKLEEYILRKLFEQQGAVILDLPPYVFTEFRDGVYVTVNYSSQPYEAALPENSTILLGERTVNPGGVLVWTEY